MQGSQTAMILAAEFFAEMGLSRLQGQDRLEGRGQSLVEKKAQSSPSEV